MANELTLAASGSFSKGSTDMEFSVSGTQVTISGTAPIHVRQEIGTSAEALDIGDISTVGWMFVVNRDSTNYVEIRDGAAGADVVKVSAGKFAFYESATSTPFGIADTAACDLEMWIFPA